jgi:DNA-binding beta-propeller fold protein YncE
MHRIVCSAAILAGTTIALAGATPAGSVLPTEWTIAPPPDLMVATGTLPQGAAFSADGAHFVVVENGQAGAAVRIFNARTLANERRVDVEGATGDPLADPSGSGFWVSAAAGDALLHIDAATGAIDRTIPLPEPFWAAEIARSPDGKMLAATGELADAVVLIDAVKGNVSEPIHVGRHPYGLAFGPEARTLYVADWGESSVSAIGIATHDVRTIAVGKHPNHLLLSPDGTRLYVSEADDDTIGVIDTESDERIAGGNAAPYNGRFYGASPSALALAPDAKRLFVADAAANAIAVMDVSDTTPRLIGAIPAGRYPTALAVEPGGAALDVVNGKGEGSHPNPQYQPYGHREYGGYVAALEVGSIRRVPMPSDSALASGLDAVRTNARFTSSQPPAPLDTILRPHGPLHHVIYVIKENRTYDQVLGDVPGANGDPSLALFDAKVTPNEHAIAERFGVLDNTYADAEVSAPGHNWSTAAFANDYVERTWPANYGDRREHYDFEDGADAARPHGGYLWDTALAASISVRNYGEFTTELAMKPQPLIVSHMAGLSGVTDPRFPGFDLSFSDEDRQAEWAREFASYVRAHDLPQLEIVRFPNDHTSGTSPGKLTPSAFNAQNDLAVGRLVDAVSHSPYWRDTAIFIVEDDAQNGPDHVDAQRMTAYVASAYAAGGVLHQHYSTAGIVRSIELILGLPPLSAYDAAALPLFAAFAAKPDLRPFDALPAAIDIKAKNPVTAYRAADSLAADFSHEDRVPDAELNDLIWHAVRGASATPPPYGAFSR